MIDKIMDETGMEYLLKVLGDVNQRMERDSKKSTRYKMKIGKVRKEGNGLCPNCNRHGISFEESFEDYTIEGGYKSKKDPHFACSYCNAEFESEEE